MPSSTTDTPQPWASATPSRISSSPLRTYAETIALSRASTIRSRTIRESTPFLSARAQPAQPKLHTRDRSHCNMARGWVSVRGCVIPISPKIVNPRMFSPYVRESGDGLFEVQFKSEPVSCVVGELASLGIQVSCVDEDCKPVHSRLKKKGPRKGPKEHG